MTPSRPANLVNMAGRVPEVVVPTEVCVEGSGGSDFKHSLVGGGRDWQVS